MLAPGDVLTCFVPSIYRRFSRLDIPPTMAGVYLQRERNPALHWQSTRVWRWRRDCRRCKIRVSPLRTGSYFPVVCKNCRIVSYCSVGCMEAARPLHAMECKGVGEMPWKGGDQRPSWPRNYLRPATGHLFMPCSLRESLTRVSSMATIAGLTMRAVPILYHQQN